ncbi:MAG: hypothetical protein RML99_08215 [Anaerolineae bacterium]|nr:hypothetical protein [Anaerolineae bacterium]
MLGRLVKLGAGDFRRVGVVIGEYEHTWMGRVLMVRTPANILKDQQFDNVPLNKAQPATLEEFMACVEREKAAALAQLDAFVREVAGVPVAASPNE